MAVVGVAIMSSRHRCVAGEYSHSLDQKLIFLHLKDAPPLCGAKTPHADAGLHGLVMKVSSPLGFLEAEQSITVICFWSNEHIILVHCRKLLCNATFFSEKKLKKLKKAINSR